MPAKRAKDFLTKIKQGEAINYPRFLSWIKTLNLPYEIGLKDIEARKIKGNSYLVEILSTRLQENLEKLALLDADSRSSLATQNKSHSQNVSGSMIVCRQGLAHPEVITFDDKQTYSLPLKMSEITENHSCLIIENQQNFLSIKETLSTLNDDCQYKFNQDMFCIFASGKAITNSYHQKFLNQFKDIYLFLDLDLGGLEIASSLKALLPKSNLVFLIANNTQQMLENVISIESVDYLKEVENIKHKHPFLRKAASLILEHRKVIEQEAYLHEQ